MKSWERTGRVMRIGSLVVVAVLAFGAGLALHGSSGETASVVPKAATVLDRDRTFQPIRLVRARAGALREPVRKSPPVTVAEPTAPAPGVAAPAPAPVETPAAPAPEATAPLKPDGVALPEPSPTSTFDSEG